MKVTIIGAGNMARGIGTRVLAGGNDVELVARNRAAARELPWATRSVATR